MAAERSNIFRDAFIKIASYVDDIIHFPNNNGSSLVVTFDSLKVNIAEYDIGGKLYNVVLNIKWRPCDANLPSNVSGYPSLWESIYPGQLKKEYVEFIGEYANMIKDDGGCVFVRRLSKYLFEGKFILSLVN